MPMSLKKLWEKIEYYFKKLNKFLWAVWWTIIVSCFVILCVISYYNHRLYQAYWYGWWYWRMMESRFDRWFGNDDFFWDIRMMRNRMQRMSDDVFWEFQKMDEANIMVNKMWRWFKNMKWWNQYSQYVSVNWDQFQYDISYNSWIVDWFVRVDDQDKSQLILSWLQNWDLKVENNSGKIFFNGRIDEVNKVLNILAQ